MYTQQVFLSGMNLAWHNFGNDFGNGQYDCCTGAVLENYLAELSASGGNTLSKTIKNVPALY